MTAHSGIVIGLEVGTIGRWFRLVIGLYFSLLLTVVAVLGEPITDALSFLSTLGLYFALILVTYVLAFYFLEGWLLARTDPWLGTLIFLGPVALIGGLRIGPQPFRVALSLYYSVSSIFNFAMSYGGCEVVAVPSLIFRKRYQLYCPYNAVDVVENALLAGSASHRAFGLLSMAITVFIGGYFLLVEDQGLIRDFMPVNIDNRWALLLLIPLGFIAKSGWDAYQRGGKQISKETKGYAMGALVLFLLTLMFVLGIDAFPLWYAALVLGGFYGVYRLVRKTA